MTASAMSGGMGAAMANAMGAAGMTPGAAPAASGGSPPTLIEQIERLAKLRDSGALSEAEFQEQKNNLLGG
jgi:hypothetical protein